MPPETPNPDLLLDSHEDRIQRLEQGQSELKSSMGVVAERVDNLCERVGDGFEAMKSTIRDTMQPLAAHVVLDQEQHAKIKSDLEAVTGTVSSLVSKRKAQVARVAFWRKALVGMGAMSGGVMIEEGTKYLLHAAGWLK